MRPLEMEPRMRRNLVRTVSVAVLGVLAIIAARAADRGSEPVGDCYRMNAPSAPTLCG